MSIINQNTMFGAAARDNKGQDQRVTVDTAQQLATKLTGMGTSLEVMNKNRPSTELSSAMKEVSDVIATISTVIESRNQIEFEEPGPGIRPR